MALLTNIHTQIYILAGRGGDWRTICPEWWCMCPVIRISCSLLRRRCDWVWRIFLYVKKSDHLLDIAPIIVRQNSILSYTGSVKELWDTSSFNPLFPPPPRLDCVGIWNMKQVFVANPKKPAEVTKILVNNKTKLIAYLENFHNDRVRRKLLFEVLKAGGWSIRVITCRRC